MKMSPEVHSLIDALSVSAPNPSLGNSLDLFGGFIGSWKLEWHGKDNSGFDIVVSGELNFGWVLGGRAIQDVWKVPSNDKDACRMRAFHGTTIRFFDSSINAWRSTWIDPLNGRVRRFIGRPADFGILLEGIDKDPLERWSFRDITDNSFRWVGEESTDDGKSWFTNDEMLASRVTE